MSNTPINLKQTDRITLLVEDLKTLQIETNKLLVPNKQLYGVTSLKELSEVLLPKNLNLKDEYITLNPIPENTNSTQVVFNSDNTDYVGIKSIIVNTKPLESYTIEQLSPSIIKDLTIKATDPNLYSGLSDLNIQDIALASNLNCIVTKELLDSENKLKFNFLGEDTANFFGYSKDIFGAKDLTITLPLIDEHTFVIDKTTINSVFEPAKELAEQDGSGGSSGKIGVRKLIITASTVDHINLKDHILDTESTTSDITTGDNSLGYLKVTIPATTWLYQSIAPEVGVASSLTIDLATLTDDYKNKYDVQIGDTNAAGLTELYLGMSTMTNLWKSESPDGENEPLNCVKAIPYTNFNNAKSKALTVTFGDVTSSYAWYYFHNADEEFYSSDKAVAGSLTINESGYNQLIQKINIPFAYVNGTVHFDLAKQIGYTRGFSSTDLSDHDVSISDQQKDSYDNNAAADDFLGQYYGVSSNNFSYGYYACPHLFYDFDLFHNLQNSGMQANSVTLSSTVVGNFLTNVETKGTADTTYSLKIRSSNGYYNEVDTSSCGIYAVQPNSFDTDPEHLSTDPNAFIGDICFNYTKQTDGMLFINNQVDTNYLSCDISFPSRFITTQTFARPYPGSSIENYLYTGALCTRSSIGDNIIARINLCITDDSSISYESEEGYDTGVYIQKITDPVDPYTGETRSDNIILYKDTDENIILPSAPYNININIYADGSIMTTAPAGIKTNYSKKANVFSNLFNFNSINWLAVKM